MRAAGEQQLEGLMPVPLVGYPDMHAAGEPGRRQQQEHDNRPIQPADVANGPSYLRQHQGLATCASHASDLNQ